MTQHAKKLVAMLAVVTAWGALPAGVSASEAKTPVEALGRNAISRLVVNNQLTASGEFHHRVRGASEEFVIVKHRPYYGRPYINYVYQRADGGQQRGTHWGTVVVGAPQRFIANIPENRRVRFQLCLERHFLDDPCVAWTTGIA